MKDGRYLTSAPAQADKRYRLARQNLNKITSENASLSQSDIAANDTLLKSFFFPAYVMLKL